MAEGAGKGYKSALNIGLSQMPKTTNPDVFNDLLEAYNAIHILNASQDSLINSLYSPEKTSAPDEAMKFIRSVWLPAKEKIDIGNCVRWSDDGEGIWKGHAASTTGLALTSAEPTEDDPLPLVHVGYGPAVIKIDDLTVGTYVWTTDDHGSMGNPYRGQLITSSKLKYSAIMGRCFTPGYLMFCPGWYNPK